MFGKIVDWIIRVWSNFYYRNLILALLTVVICIFGALLLLSLITHHGQTYSVPDFCGMNPIDAQWYAHEENVELVVDDSVYNPKKPRGVILDQNPKPNSRVKKNRKIFVRVNAQIMQLTTVPNVVDVSFRQAKVQLEAKGLKIGRLSFTPDVAHGIVISQSYRGQPLSSRTKVPVESAIDLEIGQSSTQTVEVPSLKGLTANNARERLLNAMLNMGRISYDASVENKVDSLHAVVYTQFPNQEDVPLGTFVDIRLTINPSKYDD